MFLKLRIWFNLWLGPGVVLFLRNWWWFVGWVHRSIDCKVLIEWGRCRFLWLGVVAIFYRVFLGGRGHLVWWREWLKLTESWVNGWVPKLLFFGGVFSGGQDGVEDVFGVGIGQILRIEFGVLGGKVVTLTCFFPELETRTGLEYLTKLWGWLKLEGPVDDICNFWDLKNNIRKWWEYETSYFLTDWS